jgi:CelD/BcsL family acetyltransferase involved in cellulose biosynthesis
MVYNSGLDPAVYGHLSPGIVLLARLVEYAIDTERTVFDFLRGDEPYKYDMGGQDTQVYRMEIRR